MKILVVGGMHGNEPLGPQVVSLFQESPQANVDVMLANEQAIAAQTRFVRVDLNRSFPGSIRSKDYEQRRAAELLRATKKYDVVLDFHNTHCINNDCGFVGDVAEQPLYDVAWVLGLRRIVVADYDCINKFASNCLSVEISLDSDQNNAKVWYERITQLSKLDAVVASPQLELYRFVYRISIEDKERLSLPQKNLRAFEPIDKEIADSLGVTTPAYPIFTADSYTPYNYGGILYKTGSTAIANSSGNNQ